MEGYSTTPHKINSDAATESLPLLPSVGEQRACGPTTPIPHSAASALYLFYLEACKQSPDGTCPATNYEITVETAGLSLQEIRNAREKLLSLGIISISRPPGEAPRVAMNRWPSIREDEQMTMSLYDHIDRISRNFHFALYEFGIVARTLMELGEDPAAERIAGVMERLRPALAELKAPGMAGGKRE